jgi:hypothetical protein
VLAWAGCTLQGSCSVRAVSRPAGGAFGVPLKLGSIDSSQAPEVTMSSTGGALVGWIDHGQVRVAAHDPRRSRFGSPVTIAGSTLASDLALAFGPKRNALAAWTQGDLAPELMGAAYSAQ